MFQTKYSTSLPSRFFTLIFLISSLFVISSCGFKPLYAKSDSHLNSAQSCSNFKVEIIGKNKFEIAGQAAKYKLQDALNQACMNTDQEYLVQVGLSEIKAAVGIQKNTTITRYNLNLSANFKVLNAKAKPVYTGVSTIVGGYDASASDYGTYSQEQDTRSKLLIEMARDIALKISSNLLGKK